MQSFVIGATGIVGGYIVDHLVRGGERPLALSRQAQPPAAAVGWIEGDLKTITRADAPSVSTIFCTAHAMLLAETLPRLYTPALTRAVLFTSTSIATKLNSEIPEEREGLRRLAEGEARFIATCEQLSIGWTVLRPTIIYAEGRDGNVTRLSRFIRRFGFLPLAGGGSGLRQPVHAEDLAIGAIAASRSEAAINKTYALPGSDTITYREMAGRIFDDLGKPRRLISLPPFVWRAAFAAAKPFFPGANAAMGMRMTKDMVFDATPAQRDFGWSPRGFRPHFP